MAYKYYEYSGQEDQDSPQKVLGSHSSFLTSGGSPNTTTQTGTSTPNQAATKNNSQSYAGVNDFLGANKDNGSGAADSIVGDLNNQAGQIKTTAGDDLTNYQGQVNAGVPKYDDNLVKQAQGDAFSVLNDPSKSKQFNTLVSGQYQGTAPAYNPTYGEQYANYSKKLDSTQTNNGRVGLLQQQGQTKGNASLNNALIGNDQNAVNKVNSNYKNETDTTNKNNLASTIQQNKDAAAKAISDATTQASDNATKAKAALGGTLQGYKDEATKNLQSNQNFATQAAPAIQSALSGGNIGSLSNQQLQQLGISRETAANLQKNFDDLKANKGNFDLGAQNYLQIGTPDNYNLSNSISPEHAAQANALDQLLGGAGSLYNPGSQAAGDPIKFDSQGLSSALANADKQAYEKSVLDNFAGEYYKKIGQHTGQGNAATQGNRSDGAIRDFIHNYLSSANAPTGTQVYNQFSFNPEDSRSGLGNGQFFGDLLNKARTHYQGIK